jgi:putative ubiquitin-RnfH superfamily antitoxin RatB of RatAB toxin-antitoxin module
MAEASTFGVTVVLAEATHQRVVSLQVGEGTTAWQAVQLTGLLVDRDDLDVPRHALAIFGRQVDSERVLEAGDRVEILRPLPQDPKLRRRQLAREGRGMGHRPGDRKKSG